jgi:RimK family alpha-L-glutamate ligase
MIARAVAAMSILVLAREETSDVTALLTALRERGHEARFAIPSDLVVRCEPDSVLFELDGTCIAPDCVFGWVSLWQREYGLWLMRAFALAGVLVLNDADVLEQGQNKFLNSVKLSCARIPHIRTRLIGSVAPLSQVVEELGLPLVLKPVVGAKGDGVCRIDTFAELQCAAADYIARYRALYVQQYVEKGNRDIRVRVIDNRAVHAFYRYAAPGEFLTNLSHGGRVEPCGLSPELVSLAERCSRAFEAPVAGVDILTDPAGALRVIEVNVTPAITYPHDETVPCVIDYIESCLMQRLRALPRLPSGVA